MRRADAQEGESQKPSFLDCCSVVTHIPLWLLHRTRQGTCHRTPEKFHPFFFSNQPTPPPGKQTSCRKQESALLSFCERKASKAWALTVSGPGQGESEQAPICITAEMGPWPISRDPPHATPHAPPASHPIIGLFLGLGTGGTWAGAMVLGRRLQSRGSSAVLSPLESLRPSLHHRRHNKTPLMLTPPSPPPP